ncbi:MAG: TolC family protein [Magnetococcales bacterium]|nr:TolC family protein [Magnetococcales bacterium]
MLTALALAGCSVVTSAITAFDQEKLVQEDQALLFKDQEKLTGPLTLHEAMARAIKFNLDLRLRRQEEVLAWKQEDVARLEMLPRLTVAAGYSARSQDNASVSQSLVTGLVSTEPSFSRESATGTADFTMSWNLLDFGVSYFQARQEGNRSLIQIEQRRKAAHNLIKDVRFAFWKAVAAQSLEQEIGAIQKSADQAIELARKVEHEKLRSPVQALQFQLGLLEITRQLEKSRSELAMAKEELATLIHLEPGTPYRLVDDSSVMADPLELTTPIEELERWALIFRPELRIEQYQARIEADETRKAIARLFPGLEFDVGQNYDSSALLVYQHWAQAGARLSWNLLRSLTGSRQMDLSESREKVIQMRRLVMHMAVLGQTRIAYHEYRAASDGLRRIREENDTRKRLQEHSANRGSLGLDSQLTFVHTAASGALGRVQQYESFARYQSALGRLYATLGWDPLGGEEGVEREIAKLTRALRENDGQWQQRVFSSRNPLPFIDAKTMTPLPLGDLVQEKAADNPEKPVVVLSPQGMTALPPKGVAPKAATGAAPKAATGAAPKAATGAVPKAATPVSAKAAASVPSKAVTAVPMKAITAVSSKGLTVFPHQLPPGPPSKALTVAPVKALVHPPVKPGVTPVAPSVQKGAAVIWPPDPGVEKTAMSLPAMSPMTRPKGSGHGVTDSGKW